MGTNEVSSFNVAEAKKHLSELLSRVAYGGQTFLITRRGRPMAMLSPVGEAQAGRSLADVKGWLEDGDPFLEAVDEATRRRSEHLPRVFGTAQEEGGEAR